jgi:hypothetical protein
MRKFKWWLAAFGALPAIAAIGYLCRKPVTYRFMAGAQFRSVSVFGFDRAARNYVVKRPIQQVYEDIDREVPGPWMWEFIGPDRQAKGKWGKYGDWIMVIEFKSERGSTWDSVTHSALPKGATGFISIDDRPTASDILRSLRNRRP